MTIADVERVLRLISRATLSREHRDFERDHAGTYAVTSVTRPGFEELTKLARDNPSALIAVFSSIQSAVERLVVCEALSNVKHAAMIAFWKAIVDHECDEEVLGCAAIGIARQEEPDLLDKLERSQQGMTSPRLTFHLGVARLLLNDPRGVDHLMQVLRFEREKALADPVLSSHGPTMSFIALSLLKGLFHKGPGDEISQWIDWWSECRVRYKHIDSSVLQPYELAYVPPLTALSTK